MFLRQYTKAMKALLAVFFSLTLTASFAQEELPVASVALEAKADAVVEEKFDVGKAIIHHVLDAHEFHFFEIGDFHASIPLPVILYSPTKGLTCFSYGKFGHGAHKTPYQGYQVVDKSYIAEKKAEGWSEEQLKSLHEGAIVAQDGSKVYDFSMTKNVVQLILASIVLLIIMISIAKKYKKNGANVAPSGLQNAVEPIINFVKDEVAKPNLGVKYERYLPLLLTIFFFILINNIFGLLPGAANASGNIAFTALLAIVAFLTILFSANKHFWGHIFWPPGVPLPVKFILIPVEFLSLFIKPAALMIRLFANMTAGHIIILSFVSLIFIFREMSVGVGIAFTPISVLFAVFIYLIEVLVAFIQAYIFVNLTSVFIGQVIEESHDEAH